MRKVLVVDDNKLNRIILKKILESEYEVLEADGGQSAIDILHERGGEISAVLLDIIMPVIDGYQVLSVMREDDRLMQLPVIVTTGSDLYGSEVKALTLGANDYIIKPYNPDTIRHRLRNTIRLRETAAIANATRIDALTGLLSRTAFFEIAGEMIAEKPEGYYIMACFDVNGFKVINDQYGSAVGDSLLRHIARTFRAGFEGKGGICSRITADNFATLYPYEQFTAGELEDIRHTAARFDGTLLPVTYSIGRYLVNDKSVTASAMYDRATIAKDSIKGRFDIHVAMYDESMRKRILKEQEIISEMKSALEQRCFEVWFQPQYNHATGALIGAEALVRWRHPVKGLIPPGVFIPVFEKNGFIYELDKFIWEQSCALLERWTNDNLSPLPISVNISRYDLFREDLVGVFERLIDKYHIPASLLRLEITESAFSDSTDHIINIVKQLIACGFTVEIDDFGSGYSSLNTLKDVPADVLKLDMRFLENNENSTRGGNILESVVRMARWLGMTVIAEGVETLAQADYMKSIGCNYVQGYLYAKPMMSDEYEALMKSAESEERLLALETVETLDNSAFWDPKSMDTLIFNSYVGGACIFEYKTNSYVEVLRANDKYAAALSDGKNPITLDEAIRISWLDILDRKTRALLRRVLKRAIETRDEVSCELYCDKIPGNSGRIYLRTALHVIASAGDRYLFYCTNNNITAQREAEERERRSSEQLQAIMDNINGGVTATVMRDGVPVLLFANDRYFEQIGYSREEYMNEIQPSLSIFLPEEMESTLAAAEKISETGEPDSIEYHVRRKDGEIRLIESNITVVKLPDVELPVQLAVTNDITEQRRAEAEVKMYAERLQAIMDNVGSGVTAAVLEEDETHEINIRFIFANDRYYELLGYTREQYDTEIFNSLYIIHRSDRENVRAAISEPFLPNEQKVLEYRIKRRDGKERWLRTLICETVFGDIKKPVQISIVRDITEERDTDEQLIFLNSTAHDLFSRNDTTAAINSVLKKTLDYFGGSRAYIIEADYAEGVTNNTYEVCAEGVSSEMEFLRNLPMASTHYWFEMFKTHSYINIKDVNDLGEERQVEKEILTAQSIRSLIAVPLRRDGALLGFIGIDDPQHRNARIDRLDSIGDYISAMLTRRDLQAKIESDNKILHSLMDDTPGGFVRMKIRSDGVIVPIYINKGFCRLVGMTHEECLELYAEDSMSGVHPDDVDIVNDAVKRILRNGEAHSDRCRLRHGSRGYIYLIFFGRMITDETGEKFINVYYTDVSSQERLERQREELLENLPCGAGIYEVTDEMRITIMYLNRRYFELTGRSPDPKRSDVSKLEALIPEDRARLYSVLHDAVTSGKNGECDIHICDNDGNPRPFRMSLHVMKHSRDVASVYTTYTPISDDTLAYHRMLPIALAAVMNSSPDISFVKDKNLRYICCSRSFVDHAGFKSAADIIGKTDHDIADAVYADRYYAIDTEILETGHVKLNYAEEVPALNGGSAYAVTSKYPIMDNSGNVIGIYGVSRNMTEHRTAFERLQMLTDNIPGGIASFSISKKGLKLLYFNDGFYEYTGYTRDEFADRSAVDPFFLIVDEDRPAADRSIESILRGESSEIDCTYRCHAKNGLLRCFRMRGVVSGSRSEPNGEFLINAVQFDITEQTEAAERLRMSEEQFRIAASLGDRTVARYNIKTGLYYNDSELLFKQGFGKKIENVPQTFIENGIVEPASKDEFVGLYDRLREGAESATATVELRVPDGGFRWFRINATAVYGADNAPSEAILVFYDVTEQREKEAVYLKWQQSLHERPSDSYTLFRSNLNKSTTLDSVEGTLLKISFSDACNSFNMRTREYAEKFVYAADRRKYIETLNADALFAGYYRGKRTYTMEFREIVSEDRFRWLRLSVELVEYPDSTDILAYLMYENIDDAKLAELRAKELAERDPLTGILNRVAFAEQMNLRLSSHTDGMLYALLVFDIDGFKLINDSFGHATGDNALIDIASTLTSTLREDDLTGRLGGDEFVACLCEVKSRAAIGKKAKQLCSMLRKFFSFEVQMSASIGIAVFPDDGSDFDTLYHKADAALYHVKASGKDNYAFYSDEMRDETPCLNEGEPIAAASNPPDGSPKRRMLIVDDNMINRELLVNIFKDDFIIDTADSGSSAMIRLRRYGAGISVVLLDLIMPGMDGFAVLSKIRSSSEMQSIPVVVVSSMSEHEAALRAIKCGASDFVTKPVDADLLRIRVQSAVSRAENERLRAQNINLSSQRDELAMCRAVLDSGGTAIIEYNGMTDSFRYGDSIPLYIAGTYDSRPIWQIFDEDGVAEDSRDIYRLRELLASAKASSPQAPNPHSVKMTLRTPSNEFHEFRIKIVASAHEPDFYGRIIIAVTDTDADFDI